MLLDSSYAGMEKETGPWKGKSAAVVLTYDDALNVHLEHVIPALDAYGFKGTFYLSGNFPGFRARIYDWRAAAESGHELGNHTMFHPCKGELPGREWVPADYDLNNYSVQRMMDEITMTNILLQLLDNEATRTFAYPCGDMSAGGVSYANQLKPHFAAARGVQGDIRRIDEIDLYNIGSYMINGQSSEELIHLVENAIDANGLVVFLFHGVGGEHDLNVSLNAHAGLLAFLKENEDKLWIGTMLEMATFIKMHDE